MKTKLWIVIIVVIGVLAFFTGYSTPSFLHGGSGGAAEVKKSESGPKLDKAAEDYYKDLQKDEN